METVLGKVERIKFQDPNSNFKIFTLRQKDKSCITVQAEVENLMTGAVVEVHGDFKSHPKYGTSFRSQSFAFSHDNSKNGLVLFLQSIAKWIGPERAQRIAEHFEGQDLDHIIYHEPEKLLVIEGIGDSIAKSLVEAWKENKELKDVRIFLHSLGLSPYKINKIVSRYSYNAEMVIKQNPYLLSFEGFGFSTCDFLANKLGISPQDPLRYRYFILYTLKGCLQSGHLYLSGVELVAIFNEYNKLTQQPFSPTSVVFEDVKVHLDKLIHDGFIYQDGDRYYELSSFFYENDSARLINKILESKDICNFKDFEVEDFIKRYELSNKINLSAEQKDAIYSFINNKIVIVTGGPGTGKCLGKDTPVMMFDGTIKKVQDVIVGDLLMGDDSTPRRVLSLARGTEEMFKVIPTKGDPYIVNRSHILSLKETGDSKNRQGKSRGEKGKIHDISINDYLLLSERKKHHLKGYRVPVSYFEKEVPVDPYLIGFWLGNGDCDGVRVSTPFLEVIEFLSKVVEPYNLFVKKVKGDNVDYGITCDRNLEDYNSHERPNIFRNTLKDLNLLKNKHIPYIYKCTSRENRLKLLAGLIDSDGYSDPNCGFDVIFKSKVLAEDTVYLARSLGYAAYISPCKKSWTYKDLKQVGDYFRFYISGSNLEEIPIVASKRKSKNRKINKDVLVTGIKVESIGIDRYYGFEIDGNKRFLLGDFTVTHNTTLLKAFVEIMKQKNISFELLTPTGISAKKLASTTNSDAYTIHRRLGYKGEEWSYNALNKYSTQVIVVDEMSMVDQEVFYRLVSSLYSHTKLVFVGDNDQLPSVGPGSVLRELIECGSIHTIKLTQIFRQEEQSDIIKAAKKIRDGDTDLSLFKNDDKADIWFIRDSNLDRAESTIVDFAKKIKDINKTRKQPTIFQIITPRNDGPLSVASLNTALQEALNPPGTEKEIHLISGTIRRGDRVLIKKNNYDLDIYNGDIGKVVNITSTEAVVEIDDFNGTFRRVDIPIKIADDMLRLAYSISVHKSQGQEYPLVIIPIVKAHGSKILQRNLLYTALTRAKKKVIVIGQGSAIIDAIENDRIQKRNTLFGQRINQWMKKEGISLRSLYSNAETFQNVENLKQLLSLETANS